MLGEISQCASVVVGPAVRTAEIRHIQLVPLSSETVLVLVVTNSGLVEHRVLSMEHAMHPSDLDRISHILNHRLRGSTLAQMRGAVLREIQAELSAYATFLDQMFELLLAAMHSSDEERVYVDGLMQLLAQPEFKDVGRARPVLEFLESDDSVLQALADAGSRGLGATLVTIGSENAVDELQSCSVISAPYGVAGRVVGAVAVVGPTRLDYAMATALVGYMAEGLSDILARLDLCESGE
jgi:heat-inducible transcriptional repressor